MTDEGWMIAVDIADPARAGELAGQLRQTLTAGARLEIEEMKLSQPASLDPQMVQEILVTLKQIGAIAGGTAAAVVTATLLLDRLKAFAKSAGELIRQIRIEVAGVMKPIEEITPEELGTATAEPEGKP